MRGKITEKPYKLDVINVKIGSYLAAVANAYETGYVHVPFGICHSTDVRTG